MRHIKRLLLSSSLLSAFLLTAHAAGQDGRSAASYAFWHTWDGYQEFPDDCAGFASRCEFAGGWRYVSHYYPADFAATNVWYDGSVTSRSFSQADTFERHLTAMQRATLVKVVTPTSTWTLNGLAVQPGDLIVADWGDGNPKESPNKNKANGIGCHIMVVQQSLGNGDYVYCQHGGPSDAKMRRFFDVLSLPGLSLAQYRVYHVNGNSSLGGLSENVMYRDSNHPDVYLQVNGGIFYVASAASVNDFGGWQNVVVLPNDTLSSRTRIPMAGTMLREEHQSAVWLSDGFTRHWVTSAQAVDRLGGWPAVRIVPDGSLSQVFLYTGSPVSN